MRRIVPGRGCPICGFDYSSWSLIGQKSHVFNEHSRWQRFILRRRTRIPLFELLAQRKYRIR